MNAAELFVIACSLYAHDWGMAVSEQEKKCILGLASPLAKDTFRLLDNDKIAFNKRLCDHQITETIRTVVEVPLNIWQTHIRETHAVRSAQRVKSFFAAIDENLGEAVAIVSEGHYLDVERIRAFETSLPLQGEAVNVRALGLYLRIIDLFDLAQDRTPYALWKFVSPEDAKSAEEWEKHRALSPVIINTFQETSRCIKVRGATADHRVYAALEDLREYCESQLRLSNGLLNELESRYQLRLLHLDWKVEPKGFEPINVRFEFDREAMINVLSDEIYQGDRYVFLRELLQNSIDAIRLRQALHKNKKTGITFEGEIHVKIEHQANGSAIISWTDNGSGMSAFIVRNYLTVAGRSFYCSEDFKKLGVQMDPISRFGVGILSCFMVADHVDILTRQDSNIEVIAEALKIEIHNPKRHLRIQRLTPDSMPPIGTSVKVFVKGVATSDAAKPFLKLDVSGYLKEIAGFVEFPIYVEEDNRRTLILHPKNAATHKNNDGWDLTSLDCSFSWHDIFLPQDVRKARDCFKEKSVPIKPNKSNSLFEGITSFIELNDDLELIDSHDVDRYNANGYMVVKGKEELGAVRVHRDWYSQKNRQALARSSECNNMCRIYCDGILVPEVPIPQWLESWGGLNTIRIILNIQRTTETKLNLSRQEILAEEHDWSEFVFQRYSDYIRNKMNKILGDAGDGKSSRETYYYLLRLITYGMGIRRGMRKLVADVIGNRAIPLLVLKDTGEVVTIEPHNIITDIVKTVPEPLAKKLSEKIFSSWGTSKWLKNTTIPWSGGLSVFSDGMSYSMHSNVESCKYIPEFVQSNWLTATFYLKQVCFLYPSKPIKIPLLQEIWLSKKSSKRKTRNKTAEKLSIGHNANLNLERLRREFTYHGPKFVEFAMPFEDFFTAGWQYLNVRHSVTKTLAECLQAIVDQQNSESINDYDLGRVYDALYPLFGENRSKYYHEEYFLPDDEVRDKCESIRQLFKLTSELGIFEADGELIWSSETLNVPPVLKDRKQGTLIISLKEVGR